MTTHKSIVIALLVLAAATALYLIYFRDSDERAVRKRLDAIMANVEKPSGEGNIAMAAKFQSLSTMVADHIHAECANPAITVDGASDTVLSSYATARHFAKSISLSARNVEIKITSPDKAVLTCYGTADITTATGERISESRPAILTFVKKDGKWLLSDAREHTVFK